MDSEIYFSHPSIHIHTHNILRQGREPILLLKDFSVNINLAKYTLLVLPVIMNSLKLKKVAVTI